MNWDTIITIMLVLIATIGLYISVKVKNLVTIQRKRLKNLNFSKKVLDMVFG
jgi:hypothetical protein